MNPEDYLDSKTMDQLDGKISDHDDAEAIIFWGAVGFWCWFGLYHMTIWALG